MTDTISCRQGRYARTAAWLGLGAALTAYIALSVQHIRCPGLGYDEVMWASTAVGRLFGKAREKLRAGAALTPAGSPGTSADGPSCWPSLTSAPLRVTSTHRS